MVNVNAVGNSDALENKISSRCSTDKLARAPFLNHCALNNDERATSSRFPLTNARWRVRGRLTLMLAAAADATATPAPARHLWFANVTLGVPFATPRTRRASQVVEWFACHPTVAGWRMVLGAGSGGKNLVAIAPRREKENRPASPSRHLRYDRQRGSRRAKHRHGSAAPLAGLINLHPLHSLPHSATQITRDAFTHSDGRKLPRPAKTAVPQRFQAARLRPAKKSELARDASHGQDIGITARGSACRRSGCRHACQ